MDESDARTPLDATGERLVPEAYAGQIVLAEHLARYHLAARLAPGRRVLDAASGEGYGTAILAAAGAAAVCGVDVDAAVVGHARDRYGLDFRVADLADLPFAAGDYDLIVSFESIEHVADPERALDEFARVLGPNGLLLVSTPNPAEYLEDNPFHLREMMPSELSDALAARFESVRLLYQQNFLSSAILGERGLRSGDADDELVVRARKVVGVEPGRELYTLALCGPEPLPELDADVAVLSGIYEAHRMASELRPWQARAAEAERIQHEWEARAAEAERNLEEWHRRALEAERIQREWEVRATEAERQNVELRATLDRIARSASWRLTKPLRTTKRVWRR